MTLATLIRGYRDDALALARLFRANGFHDAARVHVEFARNWNRELILARARQRLH